MDAVELLTRVPEQSPWPGSYHETVTATDILDITDDLEHCPEASLVS